MGPQGFRGDPGPCGPAGLPGKCSNKLSNCCCCKSSTTSGKTLNRPNNVPIGYQYFDMEINKLIIWNGMVWIDTMGLQQ